MKARRKPSHKLAFFFFLSPSAFWNICQHQRQAEENLVEEEEDGKLFE